MNVDLRKETPLAELRLSAKISNPLDAARLFGVTIPTWQRWEDHEAAPIAVRVALMLLGGHLPHLEWQGWRFNPVDGLLWSPEGYAFHPGDLRSLHYLRASNLAYQREIATLRDGKHIEQEPSYLENVIPFPIQQQKN